MLNQRRFAGSRLTRDENEFARRIFYDPFEATEQLLYLCPSAIQVVYEEMQFAIFCVGSIGAGDNTRTVEREAEEKKSTSGSARRSERQAREAKERKE